MNTEYSENHFFILNKGLNSGKPLEKPCPNCFVCLCNSEEEKEQLYWLLFGLWQGKTFHPYLIGSAIPFIRIGDVSKLIDFAKNRMFANIANSAKFAKNINTIRQINQHAELIKKQLVCIAQLKISLIQQLLSS